MKRNVFIFVFIISGILSACNGQGSVGNSVNNNLINNPIVVNPLTNTTWEGENRYDGRIYYKIKINFGVNSYQIFYPSGEAYDAGNYEVIGDSLIFKNEAKETIIGTGSLIGDTLVVYYKLLGAIALKRE